MASTFSQKSETSWLFREGRVWARKPEVCMELERGFMDTQFWMVGYLGAQLENQLIQFVICVIILQQLRCKSIGE